MKNNNLAIAALLLAACTQPSDEQGTIRFTDVTEDVGLRSEATWKYGGPTLADLNNDGRYDLALTNHHEVPAQLFLATADGRFSESGPVMRGDVHGIAAGDYDQDGLVEYYERWIESHSDDVGAMARLAKFLASSARVPEATDKASRENGNKTWMKAKLCLQRFETSFEIEK